MSIVLMICFLATICECLQPEYRARNARRYPGGVGGVQGYRQRNVPTQPYHKDSMSAFVRNGENIRNSLPNISLSIHGDSYAMKFKGVAMQQLVIKRAPVASVGEPWPLPQKYVVNKTTVYRIPRDTFQIHIRNKSCDLLLDAIDRFKQNIFEFSMEEYYLNLVHIEGSAFTDLNEKYNKQMYTNAFNLTRLHIYVNTECDQYPSRNSDESYNLLVKSFGIVLMSQEIWGALRGLETLSQLVFSWNGQLYIRDTLIKDFPRFKHRGVLLDSARHFISKDVIFDVLEGMYQNKMNVLHWHLVDDQSFTFQSKVFPDLSDKGAYHPSLAYSHRDIADVIEFARLRGIRVMPEIDTPGHTYSWGFGYPELLTQCYSNGNKVPGYYGPLNPARNSTFGFLRKLFTEVFNVFTDTSVHLGGDEVPMECWLSNQEVNNLLTKLHQQQNVPSYGDVMKPVWEYYTQRLLEILKEIKTSKNEQGDFILWEEASKNDLNIPKDTIIQIWMGGEQEIRRALLQGHRVLYSSCWYLDHSKYGVHWTDYYSCDPIHRIVQRNPEYENMTLGGEVCLWSEFITSETAMSVLWPRASAAAERLWSHSQVRNLNEAGRRLQEHRCRMLRRGLQVGHINGPDYCLLPKHRENRNNRRNKRHVNMNNDVDLPYPNFVFKRINNIEPLIIGLSLSTVGAFILLLLICLKFKSRVFVICWTFR